MQSLTIASLNNSPMETRLQFDPTKAPGKIAHNSDQNSCYVAVLLNTIRTANLTQYFEPYSTPTDTLESLIVTVIPKIDQGVQDHLRKPEEGVISVEEIRQIQTFLKKHKFTGLDNSTDEDPMGILHSILEHVKPDFSLFEIEETHYYDLNGVGVEDAATEEKDRIIVNEDGRGNPTTTPGFTISLDCTSKEIDLKEALAKYFTDLSEAKNITVHTQHNQQILKYSNATRIKTTRAFSKTPDVLIIELRGRFDATTNQPLETTVSFNDFLEITDLYGILHCFELHQVNCHEHNHEYAYLKHDDGNWYLTDDMQPIQKATLQQPSFDINKICKFGRSFVYKIKNEDFNRIKTKVLSFSPENPSMSETKEEIVRHQLQGLIEICKELTDPKHRSLQKWLEFSWGISTLPKEKKFSKLWISCISERDWLLLEDISRQLVMKYPKFPLEIDEKLSSELLARVSKSAETLVKAFSSLRDNSPLSRLTFPEIGSYFSEDFDDFVLDQVLGNIDIISKGALNDTRSWLKKDITHVKALFRAIEVVGEASKILSPSTLKKLPILAITTSENRPLWGILRNQLHHNKKRCFEIAELAPEKWEALIKKLLLSLRNEIASKKQEPANAVPISKDILENLCKLCSEDHFNNVRYIWKKIESHFKDTPYHLKRILFGLEKVEEGDFLKNWKTWTRDHLKPGTNVEVIENEILQMFQLANQKTLQQSDIQKLKDLFHPDLLLDKANAVEKLKELLANVTTLDGIEGKILEFERLAEQFLFLKQVKTAEYLPDNKLKESLKSIIEIRMSQINPFNFNATHYDLIESFVQLKFIYITHCVKKLKELLHKMGQTWPDTQITDATLKEFCHKKDERAKNNLKDENNPDKFKETFAKYRDKLLKFEFFKQLAPSTKKNEDSFTKLRIFPYGRIANIEKNQKALTSDEIAKIENERTDARQAIEKFLNLLTSITFDLETIRGEIKSELEKTKSALETAENYTFQSFERTNKDVESFNNFFNTFSYEAFVYELDLAHIQHPFSKEKTDSFNSFINRIKSTYKGKIYKDLGILIDLLVKNSEGKLCIPYILSSLTQLSSDNIVFFTTLYKPSVKQESNKEGLLLAWENLNRKLKKQHLSAEELQQVIDWLPPDEKLNSEQIDAKNTLINYLNGFDDPKNKFELSEAPRFEHCVIKLKKFNEFLKTCFSNFNGLAQHEAELVGYFKKAHAIRNNSEHFPNFFERKVKKLGHIYDRVQKLEKDPKEFQTANVCLLGAEYDLQEIGELAQLIMNRPTFWNRGRHILSSQHLFWIGLLRKMMAHYPLVLAPPVMRWNLEYLAFDTRMQLSGKAGTEYSTETDRQRRKALRWEDVESKKFDIENYLDLLNLNINFDILFPSLNLSHRLHLHPFGELALMVYPGPTHETKAAFAHAVMELELILKYEFGVQVSIIGEYNQEFVSIPSQSHIPQSYLNELIKNKQSVAEWIHSHHVYDHFLTTPWNRVIYKSGLVVTHEDYLLHLDLVFFLKVLGFEDEPAKLQDFLNNQNLSGDIKKRLVNLFPGSLVNYSESTLYKWICILFQRFCPPGTQPLDPIHLPPRIQDHSPLIFMLDEEGNGMPFMDEKYDSDSEYDDEINEWVKHYYKEGYRLDIIDDRSVLDASDPIQEDELQQIAEYASDVLKAHVNYIQGKINPEFALKPAFFNQVKTVVVNDPTLVSSPSIYEDIDKEIMELISKEAKQLATKITNWLDDLSKRPNFRSLMLALLENDREIEEIAQPYYDEHRLRIKGPYIQLNESSRSFFDENCIISVKNPLFPWHWVHFSFNNCFQKFLQRIFYEYRSFDVSESGSNSGKSGSFSEAFKSLVTDEKVHEDLKQLIKKRIIILNEINKFDCKDSDYSKWDKLFRMIKMPKSFHALRSLFDGSSTIKFIGVQNILLEDFKHQYQYPPKERESAIAFSGETKVELYPAREYFDGKKYAQQLSQEKKLFDELKEKLTADGFISRWLKLFGASFQPFCYSYLIVEVITALEWLINRNMLPSYTFDRMPTYVAYWEFVEKNDVQMHAYSEGSGLCTRFKGFINDGGTFETLLTDPTKKAELEQNPTYSNLIEAYIPFFKLEETLSNWYLYLLKNVENHIKFIAEKKEANQSKEAEWVILKFDEKIAFTKKCLEKACLKMEETLKDIRKEKFFEMLKLSIKWRLMTEESTANPTDENLEKRALLEIINDDNIGKTQDLLREFLEGLNCDILKSLIYN